MYTRKHVDLLVQGLKNGPKSFLKTPPLGVPDWKELTQLANRQCVAPLLFKKLEADHALVPDHVFEEMREQYLKYAARSVIVFWEFARVFKGLHEEGIPFIVLKGAFLAEAVYHDPALRPLSDLDLLIGETDLPRIPELLGRLGYSPDTADIPDRARHHLRPFLKEGAVPIEIHRDIQDITVSSRERLEGLWKRSQMTRIGGVDVRVLSPEDLLLHLSLHALQHHFTLTLLSIYDIAEILRCYSDEIDWSLLLRVASEWNAAKTLFLILRIAKDLVGAPVPPSVIKDLRPLDFEGRYLTAATEQIFAESRFISDELAQMVSSRTMKEKMRIIFSRLFPPREFISSSYSSSKSSSGFLLSYLKRVTDLFRRYGPIAFQMAFKNKEGVILPDEKRGKALFHWLSSG